MDEWLHLSGQVMYQGIDLPWRRKSGLCVYWISASVQADALCPTLLQYVYCRCSFTTVDIQVCLYLYQSVCM